MMKYTEMEVVFREIPDEITLAINISNCPIHCPDCHSKYLWRNIGTPLSIKEIEKNLNSAITCICFMGGEPSEVAEFAKKLKKLYPDIKIGYYCGYDKCPEPIFNNIQYFDYIKIGPFIKECGPLDCPTTNQRLYQIGKVDNGFIPYREIKLWK